MEGALFSLWRAENLVRLGKVVVLRVKVVCRGLTLVVLTEDLLSRNCKLCRYQNRNPTVAEDVTGRRGKEDEEVEGASLGFKEKYVAVNYNLVLITRGF